MWFAVYDYEFSKEEFLTNYKHYKIGLKGKYMHMLMTLDEEFNKFVFWRWIFYGVA